MKTKTKTCEYCSLGEKNVSLTDNYLSVKIDGDNLDICQIPWTPSSFELRETINYCPICGKLLDYKP